VISNLPHARRPVEFVGSSRDDLRRFPLEVRSEIGHAIFAAQIGGKHPSAKPWRGLGSGIFEIVCDDRGDTCRVVYTVDFKIALYVLHAFKKKSKSGIATPKFEIERIKGRLQTAREHFETTYVGRRKT
jgi:phage-related protein